MRSTGVLSGGVAALVWSGGLCGSARGDVKGLACAMPALVAGFGATEEGARLRGSADAIGGRETRERRLDEVPSPGTMALVTLGAAVVMRRRR